MSVRILIGDCRERLKGLPDNSVDSACTDPPYHLTSIVKRYGKSNLERDPETLANPIGRQSQNPYKRVAKGFMGQTWDGGDVAFDPETWAEVARVLKPGAHVDLVGGFTPGMREADDEAIRRARVYVDTRAGATKEAGDIVQPLASGVLKPEAIVADLAELARGEKKGRESAGEITLFKSVGAALEDLAAGIAVYRSRLP